MSILFWTSLFVVFGALIVFAVHSLERKLKEWRERMTEKEFPKLTQQPILFVDGTPNEDYPLRILRVYRQNCDCFWAESSSGNEPQNPLLILMNDHNRQRAEILDRAIEVLERLGKSRKEKGEGHD